MTIRRLAVFVASVLVLSTGADAWAQRSGAKSKRWEKQREEIREKIRSMRAWRLTDALDLDEKTAAKLFPILSEYDDKFAELGKQARKTRRALRKELESAKPDSKALDRLIDQMQQQHESKHELQRDRFKAVRKVLTPEQSAKIIVLLPELDRRIRREIRKAMRGKRGGDKRRKRKDKGFKDPF